MTILEDDAESMNAKMIIPAFEFDLPVATPEQRLLTAIIIRTIKDLTDHAFDVDAWDYLQSDDNGKWSFNWVCRHIDFDPTIITNKSIEELIAISESLYNRA